MRAVWTSPTPTCAAQASFPWNKLLLRAENWLDDSVKAHLVGQPSGLGSRRLVALLVWMRGPVDAPRASNFAIERVRQPGTEKRVPMVVQSSHRRRPVPATHAFELLHSVTNRIVQSASSQFTDSIARTAKHTDPSKRHCTEMLSTR